MKVELSLSDNDEVIIYSPTKWEIVCARDGFFYVYEWSYEKGEQLYSAVKSLKDAYDAVDELT